MIMQMSAHSAGFRTYLNPDKLLVQGKAPALQKDSIRIEFG